MSKPKPGPKARAKAKAAAAGEQPDQPRPRKQTIMRKHRLFLDNLRASGYRDPNAAAIAAGLLTPGIGYQLIERFRDLIEEERARETMGHEMGLEEALRHLGDVARQSEDIKTKLAAIRTVLEVHGALGKDVDPRDRKKLIREAEELMGEIRKALPPAPEAASEAALTAPVEIEAEIASDPLPEPIAAGSPPPPGPGSQTG